MVLYGVVCWAADRLRLAAVVVGKVTREVTMRITWWSSRGCGEYRLFLDYAEKGGRWADVRIDCGEARYLGGNAMRARRCE